MKTKIFLLYAEVDKDTNDYIAVSKRVAIQFEKYRVYDDYNVLRCYNCSRYGHSSKNCKNKSTCYKCSAEHTPDTCQKTIKKCINCSESKLLLEKLSKLHKKIYSNNHHSTDVQCQVYNSMKDKKIKNIDYNSEQLLF